MTSAELAVVSAQQLVPAPQRSRFVKGLIPIANQQDNFGHHRYHGLLQLENAMNFIWLGNRTRQELPRELSHEPYRNLPLLEALDESGDNTPRIEFYRDMIRHETCECSNGTGNLGLLPRP